jgi:AcrR family transcriptional regulator
LTATSAARPRGTRLPRQARRRQLLEAALEVFVARGYHAAAMDEIAERAGVSKPVLYQHFPGKQELYLALLDESVEELIETVRTALQSTDDNRQRVFATIRAYFEFVAAQSGTFRLVFESDFTNEPAVRERVERADRKCAEMVSEVIKSDAGLGDQEAQLLSIALVGMAQVSARYWLGTMGSIPRDAAEQLVARLSWRGISGWPRTGDAPPGEAAGSLHMAPQREECRGSKDRNSVNSKRIGG